MFNLPQDLESLRELNESRIRTKKLREQALYALKQLEAKERAKGEGRGSPFRDKSKSVRDGGIDFERWVAADDDLEIALVVKVQNHRDLSEDENENNRSRNNRTRLKTNLTELKLEGLLKQSSEPGTKSKFPVLLAARAMQALVTGAETVFNPTTLYCYYRIIRELYGVAHPNWTVGAARAGIGGTTSAFVTNECVRAVFAFERALERTFKFFEQTRIFCEYYSALEDILSEWRIGRDSPLFDWVNKSIEAMWLDCQIATNPRNREMALFHSEGRSGKNLLLLPDTGKKADFDSARSYFELLPRQLEAAVQDLFDNVAKVFTTINDYRLEEKPKSSPPIRVGADGKYQYLTRRKAVTGNQRKNERLRDDDVTQFIRSETAHSFALKVVENALHNAHDLLEIVRQRPRPRSRKAKRDRTRAILGELAEKFYTIRRRVHHVLDPSKQYLKWVIDRELAAPPATYDAGELVFAATSYGAIHNWRLDDRLTRACDLLVKSLPDNGRLPTKRPFHADPRGYRTIPIGCEMTRALANLLQRTGHDFDAKFVNRMLGVFEEQQIELHESTAEKTLIGWNFEGAPNPEKPAVWVTAVSVLALDRIVRMLNTRINEVILAHFDVTHPERPHTALTLRDLIYSDYGLVKYGPARERLENEERLTAIHLQMARGHVMRATLPAHYHRNEENFSTIYYGPPGTGKTTFSEALALSARVPLLRLSPGDLILQGQELIEGRAHDVFEALSMLTQCVIIFDEFEPVLKSRGARPSSSRDRLAGTVDVLGEISQNKPDLKSRGTGLSSSRDRLSRIGNILENISEKDDPKFKFVLGGMLPKLLKLHDSAAKQSFVYCLATNRLGEIDLAAKRHGRFDKKVPVYKPDALSRAGTLLHRLSQARKSDKSAKPDRLGELERFMRVICKTIGEPAARIDKLFKVSKDMRKLEGTIGYVLKNRELPKQLKGARENLKNLQRELLTDGPLDEEEKEEEQRRWAYDYEKRFAEEEENLSHTGEKIVQILNKCLRGQR